MTDIVHPRGLDEDSKSVSDSDILNSIQRLKTCDIFGTILKAQESQNPFLLQAASRALCIYYRSPFDLAQWSTIGKQFNKNTLWTILQQFRFSKSFKCEYCGSDKDRIVEWTAECLDCSRRETLNENYEIFG